jgi:hypothetical protein
MKRFLRKIGRLRCVLGKGPLELPNAEDVTDRQLTWSLMRLSEPAFAKVWDNDEDSAYDALPAS